MPFIFVYYTILLTYFGDFVMFFIDQRGASEMISTHERVKLWKNSTPPPQQHPLLHNAFVELELDGVSIGGEVRWDVPLGQYVFQLGEETSNTTYILYEITLPSDHYLEIRHVVRNMLGVYVTRGIYDEQCPQPTLQEQLPAILRSIVTQSA
jgi:hypothetical protein